MDHLRRRPAGPDDLTALPAAAAAAADHHRNHHHDNHQRDNGGGQHAQATVEVLLEVCETGNIVIHAAQINPLHADACLLAYSPRSIHRVKEKAG